MNNMQELLAAMMSDDDEDTPISHEGQIARLHEMLARYNAPNKFKVGDLVTPILGVNIKDDGEPHIVLDVDEKGFYVGEQKNGANGTADCYNIKIGQIIRGSGGAFVTFVMPHWKLDRYDGSAS